jgi:hypothetical protein
VIRVIIGPQLYFAQAYEESLGDKQHGIALDLKEYIQVKDIIAGDVRTEQGPQLWFPGPNDEVVEQHTAISLKHNEYVK